jgi:hypothetical protein
VAIVRVTVFIDHVRQIDNPDPGIFQGDDDYYTMVKIGNNEPQDNRDNYISGENLDTSNNADWQFSDVVDKNTIHSSVAPIKIQLWDYDDGPAAPDDLMDINSRQHVLEVNILLNLDTGRWIRGDIGPERLCKVSEGCSQGWGESQSSQIEGGERAEIKFHIRADQLHGNPL